MAKLGKAMARAMSVHIYIYIYIHISLDLGFEPQGKLGLRMKGQALFGTCMSSCLRLMHPNAHLDRLASTKQVSDVWGQT